MTLYSIIPRRSSDWRGIFLRTMPMIDLFSKRQKRLRNEEREVFQYDDILHAFRVQVIHILGDSLGQINKRLRNLDVNYFKVIHDVLSREYGLFVLDDDARSGQYDDALYNFFLKEKDPERALDVIEMSFRVLYNIRNDSRIRYLTTALKAEDAISELNARFLENGIGFQFESGELIRVDSKYVHAEVVKPTLQLLSEPLYAGANQEFLKAHEHYAHRRYKECLNEALKALESTLKAICKKRQWEYSDTDTAKKLIEICFKRGLIPDYLQAQFSALRSGLESGVPTLRNKLSGHGQGEEIVQVPQFMAGYMLNLTATSILFLAEAERFGKV